MRINSCLSRLICTMVLLGALLVPATGQTVLSNTPELRDYDTLVELLRQLTLRQEIADSLFRPEAILAMLQRDYPSRKSLWQATQMTRYQLTGDPDLERGARYRWAFYEDNPQIYANDTTLYRSLLERGRRGQMIRTEEEEADFQASINTSLRESLFSGQFFEELKSAYLFQLSYALNPIEVLGAIDSLAEGGVTVVLPILRDYDFIEQAPDPQEEWQLALAAKSYGDSVVLRWAPNTPGFWVAANQEGYRLTRWELDAAGSILLDTRQELTGAASDRLIKPWERARFDEAVRSEADSLLAVAAQALYGEDFVVNLNAGAEKDIINRATELQNKHGFALFVADRSAEAAYSLGLRFVDRTVEVGKRYYYDLRTPAQTFSLINPAVTEVTVNATPDPYRVEGFQLEGQDGSVVARWHRVQSRLFSGYFLERSDDNGQNYEPLNKDPLVFLEDPSNPNPLYAANRYFIYQDSIDENYKEFSYRIRGLTPFADFGEWASLSTSGRDLTPPPKPGLTSYNTLDTNEVALEWTMVQEPDDLVHYEILHSERGDTATFSVISEQLPPGTRTFEVPFRLAENGSHYFKVATIDTAGNTIESFPLYVNVVDYHPPAPPFNLRGGIDSTGRVLINWDIGPEADLSGYRVFFANRPDREFSQLTTDAIQQNYFVDTIENQTLSESIYYRVIAEDLRFNQSEFSKILELKRPDVIPPTAPVLKHIAMLDNGLQLTWAPSNSNDVVAHVIQRRLMVEDSSWTVLATLTDHSIESYIDSTAAAEQLYEYRMMAIDDAALESAFSFIQRGRSYFRGQVPSIFDMAASYDSIAGGVALSWSFDPPVSGLLAGTEYRFLLFRAVNGASPQRYQQLTGERTSWTDRAVRAGEVYQYLIRVVFANGKISEPSEASVVTIPNGD